MLPDEVMRIAADQRRRFNALAEAFDVAQPAEVMDRLRQIVAAAAPRPGEVVLDVGTGAGVLIPLLEAYRPSLILACDLAEEMLARVRRKYPRVHAFQCDIVWSPLRSASVDLVLMNAMFGNIADKRAVCRNIAAALRPGGRLVVSHPEGRSFIDQLRVTSDLFLESLPTKAEARALLEPLGMRVTDYRDELKLYFMVAQKP